MLREQDAAFRIAKKRLERSGKYMAVELIQDSRGLAVGLLPIRFQSERDFVVAMRRLGDTKGLVEYAVFQAESLEQTLKRLRLKPMKRGKCL